MKDAPSFDRVLPNLILSTRAKVFNEATKKIEKRQRTLSEKSSRSDILSGESPKAPSQGELTTKMYRHRNSTESFMEVGLQISDKKPGNRILNRLMRNPVTETENMSISVQRGAGVMDKNKDISISANSGPILSEEKVPLQWGEIKMKKRSVTESTVNRNLDRPDGIWRPQRRTQQTLVGTEKLKGNNYGCRPIGNEDDCVVSPTSRTRLNTPARGPRTKTGSLSKASWNISQSLRNADESDARLNINKVKSAAGATSHKHSVNGQSLSPSVAQWTAQKPPKTSQGARRSNFSNVMPILDREAASGELSENKEPGVPDNKTKLKEKSKKRKIEETGCRTIQINGTMRSPLKKSKLVGKEEVKDGVQIRGKNGQFLFPKPRVPCINEKIENGPTSAQQESAKACCVKVGSKPDRQVIKKMLEPKGQRCPKHVVDSSSTEIAGQPIDDNNILIAAANAAADTRRHYSREFREHVEPFIRLLCPDDISFLNEQIHSDEPTSICQHGGDDGQGFKGNTKNISVSSISTKIDGYNPVTNKTSLHERAKDLKFDHKMMNVDPFIEQLAQEVRPKRGVSICQALLSAIIEEEDLSDVDCSIVEDDLDFSDSSKSYFEDEADIASEMLHDSDRGSSEDFKINAPFRCHDLEPCKKLKANGVQLEGSNLFTEVEYNQMCIDDRILLELSEIGLHPDPVPDLAQSEDEDIREGINKLEEKLYEQVSKKKPILLRLEKNVPALREGEQKEFEQIALDKLVEMTYEKYKACWVTRTSGSKNVNNNMKLPDFSFIKQTLAQYRELEETGISCLAEPAFRNNFLSASSTCRDEIDEDVILNGGAANQLTTAPHPQNYSTGFNRRLTADTKYHDQEKCLDDVSEHTLSEGQPKSSRVKLLNDVALGGAWKDPTGFGSYLGGGTKRKRSVRAREPKAQNKGAVLVTDTKNNSQPSPFNSKSKGKNKTKSKQKKTPLSSLPSKTSTECSDSTPMSNHLDENDLSNIQLPENEVGDLGGQDIGSWLNFDEEGLQDHDFVGLQIPMDDLTGINLMV